MRTSVVGLTEVKTILMSCRTSALLLIIATGVSWTTVVSAEDSTAPDFQTQVLPLLKNRCVPCHGPAKQEGKLSLALPQGIKRGGEHGTAIVSGDPEKSLLWQRIAAGEMPVDQPLPADERDVLRRWIAAGAPGLPAQVSAQPDGDEHWAFQPLPPVAILPLPDESALRTPVDHFIAARLQAAGLTIGPQAGDEAIIRRVSFDLTGLPPTPDEINQFLNDKNVDAYEQMVERYLDSPRYGERWGKYWLDAAGYADSNGYFGADTDRPFAYRYRDYVIRSINADKPWDQFIREQIAGDELAGYQRGGDVRPEMVELLEAVHYMRNSPDGTDSSDGNPDELRADRYSVLEGTQQILGSSLLGLTVQCARCHDHKFEPFTQRDYYRLQAVIYPAFNIDQWVNPKDRNISTATAEELAAWQAQVNEIDEQIAQKRAAFSDWAKQHRQRGQEVFADAFDPTRPLTESWDNTVPGDSAPAGMPAIKVDHKSAPAAEASQGILHIIESGALGDRVLTTRKTFDWTPDATGSWIQATFDLVTGGATAPYVGYFIALRDFNDTRQLSGGNVLLDGAAAGQASVHVDYPGADSQGRGKIGRTGYTPGRNYGVRITKLGENKFELRQIVDGVAEEGTVSLTAADLPDGAFGLEYCCGRSFLVDNVLIETEVPDADLEGEARTLAEQIQQRRMELESAIKDLEGRRPQPVGRLAAVSDPGAMAPLVRLLTRGEYKHPGEEVQAGAPQFLSEAHNSSDLPRAADSPATSTGQRLALARWVTKPESRISALLARVTVNRWWQHHFGTGIVATVDNLGYSGSSPTHPELIDYLAGELIKHNWSAKAIHRLILHSATYRQSSVPTGEAERIDPDHRLLSRYPLHRMDGEAIRDAMLAVSGELEPAMFGPYIATERSPEGDVIVTENNPQRFRRSIYLQQRRTQVVGMLEVFDAPSIVFNCTVRPRTTVPLQSLKLLNSEFVRARAAALAHRVRPSADVTDEAALNSAFRLVWGRFPTNNEMASARRFISEQPSEYAGQADAMDAAWTDFCQMLLASSAFLYIE